MNKEEINSLIQTPWMQGLIASEEFYFQKGQDALKKWIEMDVESELKESLIKYSTNYNQFLEIAESNPNFKKIKNLLCEIISYCDSNARDKNLLNQYDDNRVLAKASVRMNKWIEGLIRTKFKNGEIKGASILNALNYLLLPQENSTILSRNHREMISENLFVKSFNSEQFVEELKAYFEQCNISVKNQDNYTYLLSCIIYSIKDKWQDDVVGLMASDSTGWQERELILDKQWAGLILWNSKKPTRGAKVLEFLRDKIEDTGFFPLFYSVKGNAVYCANITDFATNQEELDKIQSQNISLKNFNSDFSEYRDEKKSAKIVFVAEGIEKIKPISVEEFNFYKCSPPRQDNLSPIKTLAEDQIKTLPEDHNIATEQNSDKMANELNQILYGPPGTGKTYNTINQALELCGENLTGLSRSDIKARFEQKVDDGRIIFTTFHQSMTYEDFVEGIKPIEPEKEGDPVIYRVVEGIFRKLCIEASFSLAKEEESVATENVLDFSLAFDNFVQELEEKLASEETIELATKNRGKVVVDGISQQGNIIIKHPGKDNIYPVSKQRLSKLHTAFPDLADVNNIDQQFRSIIGGSNSTANWSVLNAIRNNNPVTKETPKEIRKYSWDDKVQVVKSLKKENFKGKTGEPYVLIIDEINRGNVSQIFGELITLIEEDKRLGNPEAIQVQLPYSKDWFGVPPNVHIIGTMNTADRSVEALDTALRRRFSFTEMPPKPELINTEGRAENGILNGIELSVLLETINKRIEKLLDKDHMIGHSYLLSVEGLKGLKSVFQNKIVPLLQEYFFGDYGKIGLVIGSEFFDIKDNQVDEDFFAPFEDYDSSPLVERKVYHLKNIQDLSDELFIKALNELQRKNK
ncbi:McrB family protein [Leeuwenhoekiella palythoae]|uniref:5-methylcytosine-specific restriction enzyme B n=1 Tax=Leeuwenhoekiella palythoae TaxID=573501 RepID=A0A1M5U152_9FLAO|nr:AAA family ATPase [Leeuwenhoekiella palythoae]RXG27536.1 5-methylcytosine-specific restriction protein B [Leeuwenhoekiella palythoae]SHH56590.1 5-methylcytosine-specific restriction enzyme B [Leeuwenhoekiella palythoae]